MSSSHDLASSSSAPTTSIIPRNPSYPQRIHLSKRPELEGILRHWEERIAEARRKLDAMPDGPDRPTFERLYAQMLGARDQIDEAVRRIPMETGMLYEEDNHRLHQAIAALERIEARWK